MKSIPRRSKPWISIISFCSRWTAPSGSATRSLRSPIVWLTPNGGSAYRPTRSSAFPDERFQDSAMEIRLEFTFDAAHFFADKPAEHGYRRMHGHSFRAVVGVNGAPDPATGFVVDFAELEAAL